MMQTKHLVLRTDGGARGNPGPAAIGVVLETTTGQVVASFGRYIGETTNNQAEYRALLAGLEEAKKNGASQVDCYLDSELVVKQLNRQYKVKDKGLAAIFVKVWNMLPNFNSVIFKHVRREQNKLADALVNEALTKAGK